MNFSFSLQSPSGDKYYIYITPLFERLRADLCLSNGDVDVYQIVLDREEGTQTTDVKILSQISEFLAKIILSNRNIIMYYLCDDLNEIPNSNHDLSCQEYRSRLFSSMFKRCIQQLGITDIVDTPIIIKDAVGENQYVHVIAAEEHESSVEEIVKFVIDGFAEGK